MVSRAEFRAMTKAQLVDFACGFFEDTGNLRHEMNQLDRKDLITLLIEHGADEAIDFSPPEMEKKTTAASNLDLGSW